MSSFRKYKKKIVFCLSRFPYPIEKGDKLRAYFQLRDLSEHFEIHLICTSEVPIKEEDYKIVKKYCKEIHVFKLNKIVQVFSILFNFLTSKPFQVAYFTQRSIKQKVNSLLYQIEPDYIFCQLIRPAEYVKNYHHCPKVIDLMDALSVGMERRSAQSNWFFKHFYKEESARLKKYECQIINYFEKILIISQQDKEFILHPNQKDIIVLPNGVNEGFLVKNENSQKNTDILFTGNMNYFPNVEAAKYLFDELYPYFKSKKLKTVICGANPSLSIQKMNKEDFEITGWVDDISLNYLDAKLFVAPMFSGSGMQNKILEAMAMGVPCITTTLANNAILAKNNIEILIANTKEEFIEKIDLCLNKPEFYAMISSNARKFIEKKYIWKTINIELTEIILSA